MTKTKEVENIPGVKGYHLVQLHHIRFEQARMCPIFPHQYNHKYRRLHDTRQTSLGILAAKMLCSKFQVNDLPNRIDKTGTYVRRDLVNNLSSRRSATSTSRSEGAIKLVCSCSANKSV
jgi:hypothetical protein